MHYISWQGVEPKMCAVNRQVSAPDSNGCERVVGAEYQSCEKESGAMHSVEIVLGVSAAVGLVLVVTGATAIFANNLLRKFPGVGR